MTKTINSLEENLDITFDEIYELVKNDTIKFENGYIKNDGSLISTSSSKRCSILLNSIDAIEVTIYENNAVNVSAVPIVFLDLNNNVVQYLGDYTSIFENKFIIVPENAVKAFFSTASGNTSKFNIKLLSLKSKKYAYKNIVDELTNNHNTGKICNLVDISTFSELGYINNDGVLNATTYQKQNYKYKKFSAEGIKKIIFSALGDSKALKCGPIIFFEDDNNVVTHNFVFNSKNNLFYGEVNVPDNAKSFIVNILISNTSNAELLLIYQNDYNTIREKVKNKIDDDNTIICVGDSLTNTYPSILKEYLGDKYNIIHCNKGGEQPLSICARQGSIPYILANDVIIPSTGGVVVDFKSSMLDENGEYRDSYFTGLSGPASVSPCYIGDIEGTLSIATEASATTQNGGTKSVFTFTRNNDGEEKQVYAGEPLITMQMIKYRNCKQIIFMGQNGGWKNTDDLISMFERSKNFVNNNVLLIYTMHRGDQDKLLSNKFGIDYLSLYDYFSQHAVEDAIKIGILEDGNKDDWRSLLIGDGVHPNEIGTKILAYAIYQRGLKTGMW